MPVRLGVRMQDQGDRRVRALAGRIAAFDAAGGLKDARALFQTVGGQRRKIALLAITVSTIVLTLLICCLAVGKSLPPAGRT